MKESAPFNVGDKVKVSPEVMGYGIAAIGIVSSVEYSLGQPVISVDFIEPRFIGGKRGCTVSNIGLLKRL